MRPPTASACWRRALLASVLLGLASPAFAQTDLPAAPVPVVPGGPAVPVLGQPVAIASAPSPLAPASDVPPPPPAVLPGPAGGPRTPLSWAPPPPPPAFVPATDPGPHGWGPYCQPSDWPGWFVDLELAVLFPAVKFRITNDFPLPASGRQLFVPDVSLDTAVSPTLEVGYRLPESAGLFALSYNFLVTEGTGTRPLDGLGSQVRTRLAINSWNLDYGTTPFEPAPRYTIATRVGVRVADVFFDSRAVSAAESQQASSHFFGAGPHARLDVERRIVIIPGLSLFGRADGSLLVGQVEQKFRLEAPPGGPFVDQIGVRQTQAVPVLNLQAGLSYRPPGWEDVVITAGYVFEEYFNVGRIGLLGNGETSNSRGSVYSHGFFLRGKIDF